MPRDNPKMFMAAEVLFRRKLRKLTRRKFLNITQDNPRFKIYKEGRDPGDLGIIYIKTIDIIGLMKNVYLSPDQ